jgi:hypothetical protein
MRPQLIEAFSMIGDDGNRYTIQRWQGFRLLKKGMLLGDTDRWAPNAFFDLRTTDGRDVSRVSGEDEVFRIKGSDVKLRREAQRSSGE